ncbi:MAG TPA: bifunctional [glutamate--ammonia ligase]-adenylyl-L-tyrosine phosphorylase/[glutamate--ammonia-ligase] adenylyltransferase [Pusillimonas sp.]|uniref:bifunctional [glutamate--ammonia ligase]-adenylyl-L-tyrosine phosphorylase/[glutamate--ammonia-ligase] adenylyltransferase n=1 Tax=Pusillimonas sp. TaxID=3040095 RepID=UPI002C7C73A3|nr:bifunctional [glutamate--ammonia ligase]-adenylyl-L-tyrosine phosphorylase/[glutamate--ammonia-ligase] adenylyltransferase [Pusillimonas sp.]HUH87333.1 bifunctional [glutamate--ammonia ligase]-adenylyl-L-tyrosine phosphorylase/[glutamate--ammonia-ligase] adenylyltransferase [Pusillimonas sp.]
MTQSPCLANALEWSGALRRKVDSNIEFTVWLESACRQAVNADVIQGWFTELLEGAEPGPGLPATDARRILRLLRQRVFYTLMVRDINGIAPLSEVVGATSALADLAIAQAYQSVAAALAEVHGTPMDPNTGKPQEMIMIGMGKLGGKELNVSSDIDLIMLYGEEGETNGKRKLSHHEFYGRLVQRMMPVLSEPDAHGQVFRTDLRLRPDGDSGPLAWSLDSLEHYLVAQGREWERYAWLKARPIPCTAFEGSEQSSQLAELESLRIPFVYRKYFDFDALAALRQLRERIREDWQRRAQARTGVDAVHNIKLGDGGIREIEFVVQLNQLIRGGRMPSLQKRGLQAALDRQKTAGVVPEGLADKLQAAYCFLRRTEHMLQYREDEQTHLLPSDPTLRRQLAQAMGMQPDAFETQLAEHRRFVEQTFRNAFRLAGLGETDDDSPDATPAADGNLHDYVNEQLGQHAGDLNQRIETLLNTHRMRSLPANSRKRLDALLPAIIDAAAQSADPEQTAIRLLDLIEHIAQRSAYLALLAEYPEILARVSRIVGASPWASQYLSQYPLLLDSLIEWRSLMSPLDLSAHARHLHDELDASVLPDGGPDVEQQMNLMRDTQRQITFQLLAQDLAGVLTVEQLADQLSALADLMLEETLYRVWPLIQPKGAPSSVAPPRFAVIAYGKLGGKELGYASDLDLVFLYDDPRPDAAELYAKLGRRMASWLSTMTSSGRLYEIDLRLRPDGDAGVLAVSLEAFSQYQLKHAWPWEHQAITRARFAAGDAEVGRRFEAVREQILLAERDPEQLKQEVRAMRDKISAGHPNHSKDFDLKHDRGGMVDVEFVTQYLVLAYARSHPVLVGNLGNIALLGLAGQQGLIPVQLATEAADAYRVYRRMQHALRLQGAEKARVSPDLLAAERACVRLLWDTAIGT